MHASDREARRVRQRRTGGIGLLLAALPSVAAAQIVGIDAPTFWLLISALAITGLCALFMQQRLLRRLERAERAAQRAASEQREAERRYRLFAGLDNDVIWTAQLAGTRRYTYMSPALERLCHLPPAALLDRPVGEGFVPESAALLVAECERLSGLAPATAASEIRLDLELRCADGTTLWTETRLGLLHDESGSATGLYGVMRDISERRKLRERLDYLAHHDALTGLPNRMLFFDRLERAVAAARRDGTRLALLYLDLDGFKEINDTHGHAAGDTLLIQVALRLSASVRDSDTVARMGGDEFTVILRTIRDAPASARIAEKILAALAEPVAIGEQSVRIGVSIGASLFPEHGDQVGTLVALADAAMARSKRGGRNRWSMAIPDTVMLPAPARTTGAAEPATSGADAAPVR